MSDIGYELMDSLKDHLTDKMITNKPAAYLTALTFTGSNDEEYVFEPSLIQIGRYQDDPTDLADSVYQPSCYIAIHPNDPSDMGDGWKHTVASPMDGSTTNIGVTLGGIREIGGSELWWRRFYVQMEMFFIDSNQDQDEASRLANMMRAMLEQYCGSYNPSHLHGWDCVIEDTFGETALQSYVAKSHMFETGGPDDDYIWKGGVWIQVMCARD